MDKEQINAYFQFLKHLGYTYVKHDMGFYLNRHDKKFSVVKIGDFYDLFFYKKVGNQFAIADKWLGQFNFLLCIQWIFVRAR